jgi:predicted N-formylglutamate amidohydrolase
MNRHIAYDIGAAGMTRALADALDAPAVLSNFSRMVIDPNRGLDDPTLLMKLYDGSVIPTNRDADVAEKARRVDAFYTPYHTAYAELAARQENTVIVAIHSFTPQLNGRPPRPWHVGVLHEFDNRLSDPLLELLRREPNLCVGDNEPYAGHLPGDAVDRHALQTGRANVLIEVRNDLIETHEQQIEWGQRLAPILTEALENMDA